MKLGILTDLHLCTGCWTCSMTCKTGNHLADDVWWMKVNTVPSGTIDDPAGTWPNLKMSWLPIMYPQCTLCAPRTARGLQPFCVWNCPTKARTYGDLDDPNSEISMKMKSLTDRGFKIYQSPDAGTATHAAAWYGDKERTQRVL